MEKRKIIVTADDYGMSRAVNDAIDAGIEAGVITTTNVMVNMPFYKEAIKLRENSNISLGIHWVLTCGYSVMPKEKIPTLVKNDGSFYSYSQFKSRFKNGKIKKEDIVKELRAQYELFYEQLGQPDYWNTHQNSHVGFGIYELFVDLSTELGINKMRSHERIYVPGSNGNQKSLLWRICEPFKTKILHIWQMKAHKKGILSPDGIIVKLSKKDGNNPEYIFNHIKWKNSTIGEYVIHPATENDSPYFGGLVEQRMEEYKLFSNSKLLDIVSKNGCELVSFGVLGK